jgi:hypothetical protein
MNRMLISYVSILLTSCVAILGQDAATSVADIAASRPNIIFPRERIENLGKLKQEIKSYYECTCTCGCYGAEIEEQTDWSIQFLRNRFQQRATGERLAIVLDVDETALSNYEYLVRSDFTIEPNSWSQWVDDAQAAVIPGTLRVFKEAKMLHMAVFFISGRRDSQRKATEKNLRARGYENWDGLILRSTEQEKTSAAEFKAGARQKIVDRGFHIVLNLGDQISDMEGYPQADLSVKLPDPFYYLP